MMDVVDFKLKVMADTMGTFHCWNIRQSWDREDKRWSRMIKQHENSSYPFPKLGNSPYLHDETKRLEKPVICQDVHWAQDGTSFVSVHNDYGIRQYLVPETEVNAQKKELIPFTRVFKSQSIVTSRVHPKYSLFNGSEDFNLILLSQRDMPLQLYPLSLEASNFKSLRSFNVNNHSNERYQVPYAITFDFENRFLVGFDRNRVSIYDINRSDPVWTVQSSKKKCGASLQRHIVSCFDQPVSQSLLENETRYFGTYKNELHVIDQRKSETPLLYRSGTGNGFIQILKSANGKFLYVVKRNSSIIDVVDVRQTHQKINELELPFKIGTQKFKASSSATTGLTIGTDCGSIVNWSSDLVEFGGIDKTRMVNSHIQRLPGALVPWDCSLPYEFSRINIIRESPAEDGLFLLSYSPDKFAQDTANPQSGISLAHLSIV